MVNIEEILKINWVSLCVWLLTLAFAIKGIIDIISYYKNKFRIKTGSEEDKETIEERINILEKHVKSQYDEISKILQGIDDIKKQLKERDIKDDVKTIATLRSQLYGLHEKFIERKSVDRSGLKTFLELGKIYEEAGGDDVYHDKLKPEVMKLPIVSDKD